MNWNSERVKIKQNAVRLYATLMRFILEDDLVFTVRMLSIHSFLSLHETEIALSWLVASNYMQHAGGFRRTWRGDEWYREILANPSLANHVNDREFRIEVLTGMDIHGAQTLIRNAALPGSEKYIRELDIDTTEWEQARDIVRQLSVRFGKPEERIAELLVEGRIGVCKGIGGLAAEHPGIFHLNGNGRLRSVCADCERLRKGSHPRTRVPEQGKV